MPSGAIPGANVLLMGPTGSGKTHALRTIKEAGVTPFILFTEPGMRTVSDIPCPDLHWQYIRPATPSWEGMASAGQKISDMTFESLTKIKVGINKREYAQWLDLIGAMNNFKCDRCGEEFGSVSDWDTDRAICLDSLSGVNLMAMDLVAGAKPVKAMGEWGVAMDNLERFILKMTNDTWCHFILTAHLEREVDEVLGGVKLMASILGRKLGPRLPRNFDDVVCCVKEGKSFTWSTAAPNVDLKQRNLPLGDGLAPTFVDLLASWKQAGGAFPETTAKGNAA